MPTVGEPYRNFLLLLGVFAVLVAVFVVRYGLSSSEAADPNRWVIGPRTTSDVIGASAPVAETGATAPASASGGGYRVVQGLALGGVRGVCTLSKPVNLPPLEFFKDQDKCGHTQHASERAIFDPSTLTLANCVLWLEGITEGKEWPEEWRGSDRTAVLDQKGCIYVPHVLVMRSRTQLIVKNSDNAEHNIKGTRNMATPFNLLQSAGRIETDSGDLFLRATGLYALSCDIHPWMNGSVHVFDTPYFALTGMDGAFEFVDVPEGTWTLRCWHEGLEETAQYSSTGISGFAYGMDRRYSATVTVKAGEVTIQDFTIEAP